MSSFIFNCPCIILTWFAIVPLIANPKKSSDAHRPAAKRSKTRHF